MHSSSYKLMGQLISGAAIHVETGARVLDIGALDINGSYRELVETMRLQYVGLDKTKGPNVDVVGHFYNVLGLHDFPGTETSRHEFDIVISGQQLEHDPLPHVTVNNAARWTDCKYMILIAPFTFPVHHPPDYWRFTDEGLAQLLTNAGLEVLHKGIDGDDAWAVGKRPRSPTGGA